VGFSLVAMWVEAWVLSTDGEGGGGIIRDRFRRRVRVVVILLVVWGRERGRWDGFAVGLLDNKERR